MCSWKRCAAMTLTAALLCTVALVLFMTSSKVHGQDDGDNVSPRQEDAAPEQIDSIKLQGKSRQVTEKFQLERGISIFRVTHDGDSNFVIRLRDDNGQSVDTLFNQIGAYEGDQGFAIAKTGLYLLDVSADGNWTVGIRQPQSEQGQPKPATMQGSGSHATKFLQLDKGLSVFSLQHNGEARFRVTLLDAEGRPIDSLVKTLGAFDGSKPISIEEPGIYFLNVVADGDWVIDVE